MTKPADLVNYLSSDYSIDYWSDVAIEHAIVLANKLSQDEWGEVCISWKSYSVNCQIRLAEITSDIALTTPLSIRMLIDMLPCKEIDIVEASLSSLYSISQHSPDHVTRYSIHNALKTIKTASPIAYMYIKSLASLKSNNHFDEHR